MYLHKEVQEVLGQSGSLKFDIYLSLDGLMTQAVEVIQPEIIFPVHWPNKRLTV